MQLTKTVLAAIVVLFGSGSLVDATPCVGCSSNEPLQGRKPALDQLDPAQRVGFLDYLWGKRLDRTAAHGSQTRRRIHNLPPYPPIMPRGFNATDFVAKTSPHSKATSGYPHNTTEANLEVLEMLRNSTSGIAKGGRLLPVLPTNWNLTSGWPILPRDVQDATDHHLNATGLSSSIMQDGNSTDGLVQLMPQRNSPSNIILSAGALEALRNGAGGMLPHPKGHSWNLISLPTSGTPGQPYPQIPPQNLNLTGIPQSLNSTTLYQISNLTLTALLPNTTTMHRPSLSYFSYQEISRAVKHMKDTNQTETETDEGIAFTQLYDTLNALNEKKGRIPSDRIKAMEAKLLPKGQHHTALAVDAEGSA